MKKRIDNYLLVPIEVKVMVVNDKSRVEQNFQRWKMNYNNLKSYVTPRPYAFSGNIDWSNDPSANGVYLHWTLPQALRNGIQKNETGVTKYPLVPNRWLIVRYSGALDKRIASGWIVESDYVDQNKGTVPYINPFTSSLEITNIGRKYDVHSWNERSTQKLFLTAVCPGDVTFAAYQPYNENVFSIHDPLTNVSDRDTLSYLITGWYSDTSKDILANWGESQSFSNYIKSLKWKVAGDNSANSSLYHSMIWNVNWDKNGDIPASDRPTVPSEVVMAVGNTSIDALTALIKHQAEVQSVEEQINTLLLEAFQYNLMPKLDEANGVDLLYQAIHKAWFGVVSGGTEWVVVKNSAEDSKALSQNNSHNDVNLYPDWLSQLNRAQKDFDITAHELAAMQWDLYRFWISDGKFQNLSSQKKSILKSFDINFTTSNFSYQLDVTKEGTLANNVYKQIKKVNQLATLIPHGVTVSELNDSIKYYSAKNSLSSGYSLKRINSEFFYQANEPVVLISGAKVKDTLTKDTFLNCRFEDEVVTGFDYNSSAINSAAMKEGIPAVNLTNVPPPISSLLNEFFFLDPDNAKLVAIKALGKSDQITVDNIKSIMKERRTVKGTLPDLNLDQWRQPWTPLFLMWQIQYYPIEHDTEGKENWRFDGQKYNWNGNGALSTPLNFSGLMFLTPSCSFNFKSRLDEFRKKNTDTDNDALKKLEDFIIQTDNWDFLSQTLEGFNKMLALRSVESNVVPSDKTLAELVKNNNTVVPILGNTPQPFQGWADSDFQQYRSGQFAFQRVMIIDGFGQSIEIVNSSNALQFKPIISTDMKPVKTVLKQEPYRFIEVSPRLLQPARLKFEFVSANDDNKIINYENDINPVCAWIIPNHLDKSLICYSADGKILGEARVIANINGEKIVHWKKITDSKFATVEQLKYVHPHLGRFIEALIKRGAASFNDMYKVIDETLWVIDPLGDRDDQSLSVYIGRPLALVRARLQLEIKGQPISDPSWKYVFNQQTPDFINYEFPIRLGDLTLRKDGLIGYFSGDDYDHFNSVNQAPETHESDPYIREILPGNFIGLRCNTKSVAYISMILDPRANVHAVAEIVPTSVLSLDERYINQALTNMEVKFSCGPIVSSLDFYLKNTNDRDNYGVIRVPVPAGNSGEWSWLSYEKDGWIPYQVKYTDKLANMSSINTALRTGVMQLKGRVNQDEV